MPARVSQGALWLGPRQAAGLGIPGCFPQGSPRCPGRAATAEVEGTSAVAVTRPSDQESASSFPPPFGRFEGWSLYMLVALITSSTFLCAHGQTDLLTEPHYCPSLPPLVAFGMGFPSSPCLHLSYRSLCGLSLSCTEAVQSALSSSRGFALTAGVDRGCPGV